MLKITEDQYNKASEELQSIKTRKLPEFEKTMQEDISLICDEVRNLVGKFLDEEKERIPNAVKEYDKSKYSLFNAFQYLKDLKQCVKQELRDDEAKWRTRTDGFNSWLLRAQTGLVEKVNNYWKELEDLLYEIRGDCMDHIVQADPEINVEEIGNVVILKHRVGAVGGLLVGIGGAGVGAFAAITAAAAIFAVVGLSLGVLALAAVTLFVKLDVPGNQVKDLVSKQFVKSVTEKRIQIQDNFAEKVKENLNSTIVQPCISYFNNEIHRTNAELRVLSQQRTKNTKALEVYKSLRGKVEQFQTYLLKFGEEVTQHIAVLQSIK